MTTIHLRVKKNDQKESLRDIILSERTGFWNIGEDRLKYCKKVCIWCDEPDVCYEAPLTGYRSCVWNNKLQRILYFDSSNARWLSETNKPIIPSFYQHGVAFTDDQ